MLLDPSFLTALLLSAVTAGMPLLLAGLGEQVSETAGILNIGIEGMMLAGAYAGFVTAYGTGSMALGYAGGGLCGCLVAGAMVLLCVRIGLDQVVVGIALTLGAEGVTALLHHVQFSQTYPRLPAAGTMAIPLLSTIPLLGPVLFNRPPVVYLALALVPGLAFLYKKTHLGLALKTAGDSPAALDTAGGDVIATRTVAVLTTGALAGVGGAFLSQVGAGLFVPFMTNGAGFMGIVLAMMARGRPLWVLAGSVLFGVCLSATTALQVIGVNIPSDVVQMLPFVAVMAVLVGVGRRSKLPAALGLPYRRGVR